MNLTYSSCLFLLLLDCSIAWSETKTPVIRTVSTAEMARLSTDEKWILVDTRPPDAFNGWALNVVRGGHIPKAVDFAASWLSVSIKNKKKRLAEVLQEKGITAKKNVVLYDVDLRNCARVGAFLRAAGVTNLCQYDLREWAKDRQRPLARYPNFHLLVPPLIVKQLLDGKRPETFEKAKRIKFVEVSWGGEGASYSKGHLPGSFHVNTDYFEPPPSWKLGTPAVLTAFAKRYGFQADDTVVLSSADPTAAYRLAIVLRYMGVSDVRVLNGGFSAWKQAGFRVDRKRHLPPKSNSFGGIIPARPKLIDSFETVKKAMRNQQRFTLVDTRSWAEFTGKTSGYKYHFRKGRIPGSVYGQAKFVGKNSLTPYRNVDKTMRNAIEIQALWKNSGIRADKHLSFMCGGGWRAAEVLTFAHVMGRKKTSLYSDGWIGWSNDRKNPIVTGQPLGR